MLDEYLFRIEEAKRRDHRKLGAELDLFSIREEGPGSPFSTQRGWSCATSWKNSGGRSIKRGVPEDPHADDPEPALWERSGHWDHYRENMYFTTIDEADFAVKPMNCPGAMLVYKSRPHSYRELPIRLAELGLVHRHELSGVLHGLMRVRCFYPG